ncbi:zf-HC2 domain-containing protein [Streptomyces xinghaiensis]|uniref:zf-HC2 domain-containing protein n=1 Tax=Streptomyces xinghaiensis TaxID=1038928 RepID=UPI00031F48CB|nr:zf-HC2 domain-containing protein [Streptomyces xinghaiensis]MZE75821.1 zf-HC2 domain-containing protein [Streptomyces sp. SID5475]
MSRDAAGHVEPGRASAYTDGTLPEPEAWALETHVETCSPCARLVSAAARSGLAGQALREVRAGVLAAVLAGAAENVHGPAPVPAVPASAARKATRKATETTAAAGRPGRPSRTTRFLWSARSAGPALGRSWLLSLILVTAAAVLLARLSGTAAARPLLLAVAPLLPVAGVAASYGRHADPLYEAVAATPAAGLRLLLVRTGWVLAVCVPLLTAAGLLMPEPDGGPGAHAWLLPGLTLTLLTLLVASCCGCLRAAASTGTAWLLLLVSTGAAAAPGTADRAGPADPAALLTTSLGALSGTPAQSAWAAAGVLCGGLLVLRRTSFDRLERL